MQRTKTLRCGQLKAIEDRQIAVSEQKSSPLQQQKSVCENSNMEISVDSSQNILD